MKPEPEKKPQKLQLNVKLTPAEQDAFDEIEDETGLPPTVICRGFIRR